MNIEQITKLDEGKPVYAHSCETCVFLGHYKEEPPTDWPYLWTNVRDLYLHSAERGGEVTLISRFGNGPHEYASGNNAEFFKNIPGLALAAELAIRHMADTIWALLESQDE